uniref:Uncharacterized protein n=1 Tax=Euplotes crassus TaxID=5936 RepID=A0A7S3KQR5_EUPCR|mmetsp:Transcript_34679/g.34311  ORF Transcript_34679/g.34311 Transcript_34679/m.34311 type:complete len:166 (+) Transcript_34679:377-874(+)
MGLNFSKLPSFGNERPVGIMRPTPQMRGTERSSSITHSSQIGINRADSKDDLSPRSKMFPKLKEKINTIKGGGSFTKFERNTPINSGRKDWLTQENHRIINSQGKKKEETQKSKAPNFGTLISQESKPKMKEAKPKVMKEEKKEIKPKEEKKEKNTTKKKGGKSK